ncbi:uncharacterized protein LOC132202560 [Neocloeon triangulifer]|uniref:uncharacterized protein LOC132202560 n=1 Tax=Neocloeon triangulifer TaxID=2078957 RepID=UPI00286F47D8|nr:uncharacterized protein LOC132202560 [Neocloeon triangulifer]
MAPSNYLTAVVLVGVLLISKTMAGYLPPSYSHHMPGYYPSYHDEYRNYGWDKRITSYGYRYGNANHRVEVNFNRPSAFGVYGPAFGASTPPLRAPPAVSFPGVALWPSMPTASPGWTALTPIMTRPMHPEISAMWKPTMGYDYLWMGKRRSVEDDGVENDENDALVGVEV